MTWFYKLIIIVILCYKRKLSYHIAAKSEKMKNYRQNKLKKLLKNE